MFVIQPGSKSAKAGALVIETCPLNDFKVILPQNPLQKPETRTMMPWYVRVSSPNGDCGAPFLLKALQ
ncbi:MAG TPA: hypothetical protein EYH24_01715 [Thermococcus paralvinellae]|uniref:Uncharacterized protein n=1 Tax=Thermococcus paralvinellae TaxID=582419 RepID=A0A832ZG71_9EURY|nr:hypothetical protein [Thermococcus paralvinellae]HIP88694.1 hypothetical protein [Thermococcus paralvinellae]